MSPVRAMSESVASDVANRSSDRSDMQSTGESAVSNAQMHLLLVGENKDFSYLRDLLSQSGNDNLGLDHAHSTEEALARLGKTNYDPLICEYKSGDGAALRLMHELRRTGAAAPVIFLSDHMIGIGRRSPADRRVGPGNFTPSLSLNRT